MLEDIEPAGVQSALPYRQLRNEHSHVSSTTIKCTAVQAA